MYSHCRRTFLALLTSFAATLPLCAAPVLRVCADPNNLPFSSRDEKGLENRLAEVLARDLGMKLEYVWWAERKNFIEQSLNAAVCDAVMGVPAALGSVAVTARYYRSTYVWVARRGGGKPVSSLYDERLIGLRIGTHIVDDAYAPPAQVLAQNGLAANLVGFSLYGTAGDQNPPARLIEAVSRGDVDLALAWGPLAGYFATQELEITPVTPQRFGMVPFVYDIAIGVRRGDEELRKKLDAALVRQCAAVQSLLREYKVPQVSEGGQTCASSLSARSFSR
jgi:mxaJ protein